MGAIDFMLLFLFMILLKACAGLEAIVFGSEAGTVFFKKGHDGDEEPFEFQTDEGGKLYLSFELESSWLVITCFLLF